jgi:hypothetical protein
VVATLKEYRSGFYIKGILNNIAKDFVYTNRNNLCVGIICLLRILK